MKKTLLSIIILSASFSSIAGMKSSSYEFKAKDFATPYYVLFQESDGMRIIKKTINESTVKCWVEINKGVKLVTTKEVTLGKKEFKKDPLRSCLKLEDLNSL